MIDGELYLDREVKVFFSDEVIPKLDQSKYAIVVIER